MERLIDIEELSRMLSIPVGSIYNLVSRRRIPFVKIGRRIRFDLGDISRWIKDQSQEGQYDFCLEE